MHVWTYNGVRKTAYFDEYKHKLVIVSQEQVVSPLAPSKRG